MASTSQASTSPTVTPISSDLSHPLVPIISIKEGYWGSEPVLDRIADNWHVWSNQMLRVLQLSSGLDRHLDGIAYEPDPALEPRAYTNYTINDKDISTQNVPPQNSNLSKTALLLSSCGQP
jgi:hypothetical protein